MKLRLLSIVILIIAGNAALYAQVRRCGTSEHMQYLKDKNPSYAKQLEKSEVRLQNYLNKQQQTSNKTGTLVTIPVVVHVVYKTAIQNISDAQIMSQIEVINEDFRRLNPDTVNTPSYFQTVAGDVQFEFCLAQRDPAGNPTNGIVRVQTNANSFIDDDQVKFTASGGDDAWDVSKYFNIWVCNLGGGLLGYAEFPNAVQSNTYGVVIVYNAFGRTGTVSAPYHLGRTATHEIGHCFNLYHIWGDDGGACSGSDQVADTPNQGDENYACSGVTISCSNGPNGDMYQNYMDYSDDACMNIFTQGQATRMQAALNSFYPSLITSNGCLPVVLATNDAGVENIASPSGTECSTSVSPVVILKNWGSAALTSVDINYQIDGGTVVTYAWTGNLPSLDTVLVNLPAVSVTAGSHNITFYTSSPNGVADGNAANDSSSSSFNVVAAGTLLPVADGIESPLFPAPDFTINNPDNGTSWTRTGMAHYAGSFSLYMDNYDYNASGQVDELVSDPMDLTSVSNPGLSFWLAYQLYTNPSSPTPFSDTLEVLISTDCGNTFTSLYKKSGTALTTVVPTYSTIEFVPNSAAQWRNELIPLTAYASSSNAIVMFRHTTDYENNLYVDNINLESFTGIQQANSSSVINIYPNPASDEVAVALNIAGTGLLSIYNALGAKLIAQEVTAGNQTIHIAVGSLPDGIYTLSFESEEGRVNQKLVIR